VIGEDVGMRTSQDVLTVRDYFEMLRVDTSPIAADMVDLEALGDRPDVNPVRDSVGVEPTMHAIDS
jgi:hypothetical protein